MIGYIKYFGNGGKNMSFMIKDDSVLNKDNEIWDKIKEKLSIKFHSEPVYDQTYKKVKVREFYDVIKRNFLGNDVRVGWMKTIKRKNLNFHDQRIIGYKNCGVLKFYKCLFLVFWGY